VTVFPAPFFSGDDVRPTSANTGLIHLCISASFSRPFRPGSFFFQLLYVFSSYPLGKTFSVFPVYSSGHAWFPPTGLKFFVSVFDISPIAGDLPPSTSGRPFYFPCFPQGGFFFCQIPVFQFLRLPPERSPAKEVGGHPACYGRLVLFLRCPTRVFQDPRIIRMIAHCWRGLAFDAQCW